MRFHLKIRIKKNQSRAKALTSSWKFEKAKLWCKGNRNFVQGMNFWKIPSGCFRVLLLFMGYLFKGFKHILGLQCDQVAWEAATKDPSTKQGDCCEVRVEIISLKLPMSLLVWYIFSNGSFQVSVCQEILCWASHCATLCRQRHKGKAHLHGRVYLLLISLTLADPKISSHPFFFSLLFSYCFK